MASEEIENGRRSLVAQLKQSLRRADLEEYPVDVATMRDLIEVLEAVRPMPTAEQVAMRLSLVRFSDEESDRMIELTMREAWPLADAVVGMLDGPS